jgi:hypothetical protein
MKNEDHGRMKRRQRNRKKGNLEMKAAAIKEEMRDRKGEMKEMNKKKS